MSEAASDFVKRVLDKWLPQILQGEAVAVSDDDEEIDSLETLSGEIEACDLWLTWSSKSRPAPECRSALLAAKIFGRDHHLTFWIRLLFAGVAAVPREPLDSKN